MVAEGRAFTSTELAARAGVSRQAAHRRLRTYVAQGRLAATGAARARRYLAPGAPASTEEWRFRTVSGDEDAAWRKIAADSRNVRTLRGTAPAIARYAFTEIFNNALDHSGSHTVDVEVQRVEDRVRFVIRDEGVGIWQQIRAAYGLRSSLDAVAELSKGKVTTRPERHSGEGIFFVSKAVDLFEVDSGGVRWLVDNIRGDVATGEGFSLMRGTRVRFEIRQHRDDGLADLFARYTTDLAFDRTRTLVRLFAHGTEFVSRSEAKRLLAGLDRFREVILDFDRVQQVGQGFADEVFRVWAREHPATAIKPVNMNRAVTFMVGRAQASAAPPPA